MGKAQCKPAAGRYLLRLVIVSGSESYLLPDTVSEEIEVGDRQLCEKRRPGQHDNAPFQRVRILVASGERRAVGLGANGNTARASRPVC